MKLLILTQYFPPEVGAAQSRLFEIAQRLHGKGVEVSILTAMPNYPQMIIHNQYRGIRYCKEEINGMAVHRSWIYVSQSKSITLRLFNYFSFVLSSFWYGLFKIGKCDILMVESPPLFLGITAFILAKQKRAKLVFNVSDLWPASAKELGLITNSFLLNISTKLEEFLYRHSALICGQTQGILTNIRERIPQKQYHWLKNGVDINIYNINNITNKTGCWRKTHGFATKDFLCFFGGTLNYAQDVDSILRTAKLVEHISDIKFIIYGSGPEKQRLQALKQTLCANNVFFYDAVCKEEIQDIIIDMNISLAPIKGGDFFKGTIPTKVFESLALKKPLLLGVAGEAYELFVKEGQCCLFFEPENALEMSNQLLFLYNNPEKIVELGENGFLYVKEHFNRDKIAEDFYYTLINV